MELIKFFAFCNFFSFVIMSFYNLTFFFTFSNYVFVFLSIMKLFYLSWSYILSFYWKHFYMFKVRNGFLDKITCLTNLRTTVCMHLWTYQLENPFVCYTFRLVICMLIVISGYTLKHLKVFFLIQVKETVFADDNFLVSVNRSASEIIATYKKEETGMDLVIHLPSSYPLRPVDVECTRSLGISEVKQRKWLLSLTAFVRNQVLY